MSFDLAATLYSLPAVVLGLTAHEYAHARASYALGDYTALDEGRLTLNPLKHIDPLGFLFLVIAGFGWAKPVRFSRGSLRRPRRDEAIIAIAGPLANLALALFASIFLRALIFLFPSLLAEASGAGALIFKLFLYLVYVNYGLCLFNLIPIPPLDGSHLLIGILPLRPELEAKIYRYGTFALFAVFIIGSRADMNILPIGAAVRAIAQAVFSLLGF